MLYKSKERLFLKKGEWCASSFLLLNTVKQSEPSYLASGVQRAVVPQKVNNDQDLFEIPHAHDDSGTFGNVMTITYFALWNKDFLLPLLDFVLLYALFSLRLNQ